MNKNFVQIFDIKSFERVHLSKDVGMIPSLLKEKYNFNSTIVFYDTENNRDLKSIEEGICLERLKMNVLNRVKVTEFFLSPMIWYLIKNAKKIDYLMLFHLKKQNYLYRFLYKLFNPDGKVYLKLDLNAIGINEFKKYREAELEKIGIFETKNIKETLLIVKRKLGFKFFKKELSKFDLISVETKEAINEINKATQNTLEDKLFLLYNGIYGESKALIKRKDYSEKENVIISVGRIGTEVKNNEMLLKAIELIELKDWKVYFIGPIEPCYIKNIEKFYDSNPYLKNKVFFIGNISDKSSLYEWYALSKVFCLTSLSEGFPLVFPEALYYGNYIISTNIGADKDITNNGTLGKSVNINDYKKLAVSLQYVINEEREIEEKFHEIVKFCDKIFLWENIIDELHSRLVEG